MPETGPQKEQSYICTLCQVYFTTFFNERLVSGEQLTPESPVIAPFARYVRNRGENNVLRAFFDTQLLIAESRAKIAHDFRVFFMGHKGSMEAKYTTNKGILPEMLIDEMSKHFAEVKNFLIWKKVKFLHWKNKKRYQKRNLEI